MFFVYILYSESLNKYYVDHTNDLGRILHEHNSGQTEYTSTGIPWILILKFEMESHSAAMALETKIKERGISKYLINIDMS